MGHGNGVIDCVDVTMYLKVASGLGHLYKVTKILSKLTNIFLIDKIARSKIYRFYSFAESLSSDHDHISKNEKILYLCSSQKFV